MDTLKVLLVVPRLNIGGAESYVITTALGLARRGMQVVVASWGGKLAGLLAEAGIAHYLVPVRLSSYLTSLMLEYIVRKHGIQLIHANSAAAGYAALQAGQRLHLPVVYTAHGVFGHEPKEMVLAQADKIICVSNFLHRRSLEKGVAAEKLVTIYNGIDLTKFAPRPAETAMLRRQLGLGEKDFVIGMVSRIKNLKAKGHGDLLTMLAKFQGQQPDWRVLVVGKGNGLRRFKAEARQLGVGNQICIAGHSTEVPQLMQAMDVLLLPSDFETFGLVLVEAMAMAKPVIAYAVGGTPEAIEDQATGFLIPKGDIDAMYGKLNLLYEQPEVAAAMGDTGVSRVKRMFNSDQMLDQLLAVYAEVLQARQDKN
ncbi:glycosyltransferase family 4 protein|uniref:Glycosyltransferase involved in cell wall bisynthesis n=1 Tax=Dendrosporobacter quercicolus TaxID=146817 RepID=A0A1G9WMQ1_9FIRM|nr:glycosyltransferase family 4 protein [Dendrosporobacter quercicolus]NSL49159.1 glycosyltransferase family 4 protein [Dendrosporobacter quercicolus DSM 1736]SDM85882.1 Glycosyltransferase involved in cell wall bisynthesis [Dendrosporobacter quercicolus]